MPKVQIQLAPVLLVRFGETLGGDDRLVPDFDGDVEGAVAVVGDAEVGAPVGLAPDSGRVIGWRTRESDQSDRSPSTVMPSTG